MIVLVIIGLAALVTAVGVGILLWNKPVRPLPVMYDQRDKIDYTRYNGKLYDGGLLLSFLPADYKRVISDCLERMTYVEKCRNRTPDGGLEEATRTGTIRGICK